MRGFGAGDRIRTGDIDLGKVALYQLSYSRSRGSTIIAAVRRSCQTLCNCLETLVFIFLVEGVWGMLDY
jgi:hypothetical protein